MPASLTTAGLNFTGGTIDDCNAYPPDTMGAIGPAQFLLVCNGRIRSFDKSTGATGTLNMDLDVFFASVRGADFTTDPRVRFDRLTGRWIINCINDAPLNNKILIAVSDKGAIDGSTTWKFFSFVSSAAPPAGDSNTFADYPTLGVDANALYIGAAIFDGNEIFRGTSAYVVRKSSILGAGPIVVTAFRQLTGGSPTGTGPGIPQGVDNYDAAATVGYFIGADNAGPSKLILRRVSNPAGTPTISGNIAITVPATAQPLSVPHRGNDNGADGQIDAIDDRLMAAHLRNGSLWTCHNIGVDNTGVATPGKISRDAIRWYQLSNLTGTPVVVQSGTLCDATTTTASTALNYWMGTIMVSGQGHVALGCSSAGTNNYVNAVAATRLASDPLGTLGPPLTYTSSNTAYIPFDDPGGFNAPRRWGDYSMTSVDPSDDMTMWTIQEFCNATGSYAMRILQIKAPPPASPVSCSPSIVAAGASHTTVAVTGASVAGSGFFDPGTGFTKRLSASISGAGVMVNSVEYIDPTHIMLDLNIAPNATTGSRTLIVTNPDGQTDSASILTIGPPSTNADLAGLTLSVGTLSPTFATAVQSYTALVTNDVSVVRITPTVADTTATLKINGTAVSPGSESSPIQLVSGDNIITTVVTAQDATTTRTYTLTITRAYTTTVRQGWNRPDANGNATPTVLSSTATNVPYDVYVFDVSATGTYDVSCSATNPANWDTYLFLYSGAFDATAPLSNVIVGNDDSPSVGTSGFSVALQQDTTYFLVTTGQSNSSSGDYTLSIQGSGMVDRQAPVVALEYPAGTPLLSGHSVIDFSVLNVGASNTLSFVIKNAGNSALTGLAVTVVGSNASDFTVTGPLATTLAPNTGTTFTVKFAPAIAGSKVAALHLASNDLDQSSYFIGLVGTAQSKPVVATPASLLVGTGESASFTTSATGTDSMTYTWLKNNVAIKGATSAVYDIPSVALTDAGAYSAIVSNTLGTTPSGIAKLVVVNSVPSSLTFNEGSTIVLSVKVAAPTGTALAYQWMKGSQVVTNSGKAPAQVIIGATTPTLTITKASAPNAASYSCVVGINALTKESGAFVVTLHYKPIINGLGPLAWGVSNAVTDQITAQNVPTTFVFTGLPAGVVGNVTTGQLSGKPLTATTTSKNFTVVASNLVGISSAVAFNYSVAALSPATTGVFNGLADRDTTLSAPSLTPPGATLRGHGGSLTNLAIASTGAFTGTLYLEDKAYAMPAGSRLNAPLGGNPSTSVTLVRGTNKDTIADLTFAFTIDATTGKLVGTITDGLPATTPIPVVAWHNVWHTTAPAHPATALTGRYVAALTLDPELVGYASHPNYPQGTGYVIVTTATTGATTWTGKLADGTAISGSTTLGPNGEIPLHAMLYTPTVAATAGSFHGWVQTTPDSISTPLNAGHPLLDGTLDWKKLAQASTSTTRSYKSGFDLHTLTAVGGVYVAASGSPVIGITDHGVGQNDAKLTFSEAGLNSSALAGPGSPVGSPAGTLNQLLRVTTTNTVVMPPATNNPGAVTMAPPSPTGLINGTFTLKDQDPTNLTFPFTIVPRTVAWSGVLVPRLAQGVGQFQLPQLPSAGPPKTTTATSPWLSGKVLLQKDP